MRIVIVSNRLPFTMKETTDGYEYQESVGGLVTGMSAYINSLKKSKSANTEYIWLGWPGLDIPKPQQGEVKRTSLEKFNAAPIFIPEKEMDLFYLGFCNKTIWPLFHYFTSFVDYSEELWDNYVLVNKLFAEAIAKAIKPGDIVWIHDYHLMLVPQLLRERFPDLQIGFFLHIPFPTYEIFRLLPSRWRETILHGLLGADLIGFHTHDYTQYFLRCVMRILGHDHNMGTLLLGQERLVRAKTFPMGIDFDKFNKEIPNTAKAKKEYANLKKSLGKYKVILSVDRLDYTKGILKRLEGFEAFLEKNPKWHNKTVLFMIVVPSRVGVDQYQQMKSQIEETIGRINGIFSTLTWAPIVYHFRYLPFTSLIPLYQVSDIAMITPLRDGMNLVAKEYLASRTDETGVLILSEMAGTSRELSEALVINPNNKEELADAITEALEMPKDEQIRRNKILQTRLKRYNVIRWADDFIDEIRSIHNEQISLDAKLLSPKDRNKISRRFKTAPRRLLFLDYDGTLTPYAEHPRKAEPSTDIKKLLKQLATLPDTDIVLISGHQKKTIDAWFKGIEINFIAEHGIWFKNRAKPWQMTKPQNKDWYEQIIPILERVTDELPGSFIEEKEYSMVWHYRKADPEIGPQRAQELVDYLVSFTANIGVQVLHSDKMIEIRSMGINKANAAEYWLRKSGKNDFIMAIGDDVTDEDIFAILPKTAFSIKVGLANTTAQYHLHNPFQILKFLENLNSKLL